MKRIMIIGQPGSGKSTLTRQIGDAASLPVVHIDHIHWQSGWVERSRGEKTRLCREVHARDTWVFEGGHSVTWPELFQRCDMLSWLDVPFHVRVWRVVSRSLRHWGRTRPDLPDDCPEQFDLSFYRWIWNTRKTSRAQIERFIDGKPHVRLRSAKDLRAFMRGLTQTCP